VAKELDLAEEERVLREILRDFSASPGEMVLEHYFQYLRDAIKKVIDFSKKKQNKGLAFSFEEGGAIVMIETIHRIVRSWQTLKQKQNMIFEPRDSFLRILNESSWRKRYEINAKNELQVAMENTERFFSPTNLSSGEKQLVIILGEALLQRKSPTVYIADEPELSLHVKWQEKLVGMLRDLNPQAQILFATHSPDIVARYQDRVFDMEAFV
jgi:ABC-type dipeptide/oligopeptide/nickel transport system ATPase component